jgi:hypothetical protein
MLIATGGSILLLRTQNRSACQARDYIVRQPRGIHLAGQAAAN